MGLPQSKAHYTVEDYMQWPDEITLNLAVTSGLEKTLGELFGWPMPDQPGA